MMFLTLLMMLAEITTLVSLGIYRPPSVVVKPSKSKLPKLYSSTKEGCKSSSMGYAKNVTEEKEHDPCLRISFIGMVYY